MYELANNIEYMKHITSLLLIFLNYTSVFSQNTKGFSIPKTAENNVSGKTYALIVGVAKYKNPAIPQLQYADRDAMAFRNYLVATGVDSNNITLLLNEEATNAEFWASISFLQDVAKKGDKVYIYFSGHGDVENRTVVKDAYLLPYDAPKCVYPISAIAVLTLKSWIATLSAGGIQAIFIADACRSGNLAGGREGMEAAAAMLKENWQDEIKILSCQPGELSLESKQWGGGRGLFSYELIKGMAGAADKNKDGKVTLRELNLYMMDKVPDEANPLPQNPALYGNMETVVSTVMPNMQNEGTTIDNKMLARVDVKGFEESLLAGLDDSIKYNYKMFKAALDTGNYISDRLSDHAYVTKNDHINENEPSAYYYYRHVRDDDKTHLLLALMKRDLCSAIMADAEKAINDWLNSGVVNFFSLIRLQYSMSLLKDILGIKKLNDLGFLSKFYTFETLADYFVYLSQSNDSALIQKNIFKMDSAISVAPDAAYLYVTRGLWLQKMHKDNDAIVDFKKAINISPLFISPYFCLDMIYTKNKQLDSAIAILKLSVQLHPGEINNFYAYSHLYANCTVNGDSISANYYLDIISKKMDTIHDVVQWYYGYSGIANSFSALKNYKYAIKYYFKSLELSESNSKSIVDWDIDFKPIAYINIAKCFSAESDTANAIKYLEISLRIGWGGKERTLAYEYLLNDSDLDPIRTTPEYKALMKKYFPNDYKE